MSKGAFYVLLRIYFVIYIYGIQLQVDTQSIYLHYSLL